MKFGKRIAILRGSKGWTKYRLSAESGIKPNRIGGIEDGSTPNPGIETVAKVAEALGVSLDELFYGREHRATKRTDYLNVQVLIAEDGPPVPQEPRGEEHTIAAEDYRPGRSLVRVWGKSMWPMFQQGDLLLFDSTLKPKAGDYALVRWGGNTIIRRIDYDEANRLTLHAVHPLWPPSTPGAAAVIVAVFVKIYESLRPAGHVEVA